MPPTYNAQRQSAGASQRRCDAQTATHNMHMYIPIPSLLDSATGGPWFKRAVRVHLSRSSHNGLSDKKKKFCRRRSTTCYRVLLLNR